MPYMSSETSGAESGFEALSPPTAPALPTAPPNDALLVEIMRAAQDEQSPSTAVLSVLRQSAPAGAPTADLERFRQLQGGGGPPSQSHTTQSYTYSSTQYSQQGGRERGESTSGASNTSSQGKRRMPNPFSKKGKQSDV